MRKFFYFCAIQIYIVMKRVFIIVASLAAVACVGSGTKNDKQVGQNQDVLPTARVKVQVSNEAVTADNTAVSTVANTAANYKEMAMSAIENGDSEAFMAIMEQMESWLNGLDAEQRAGADAAIEQWNEVNKERMEANFEKALTMPRMTSKEAASLRETK